MVRGGAAAEGPRRDHHRHPLAQQTAQTRHRGGGDVPHPDPVDHQSRQRLGGEMVQQREVLVEARGEQRHRREAVRRESAGTGRTRQGEMEEAEVLRADDRERPRGLRGEGRDPAGGGLHDPVREMRVGVEHDQHAQAAGRRSGRRADRVAEVRGPVGAGRARRTHRPGHHQRRLPVPEPVEQERRLLEGVGAVGEHHPGRAGVDRGSRTLQHGAQVVGAHIGGGDVRERSGSQLDVPADGGEQPRPRVVVRAGALAAGVLGHEDGAAEGEHLHEGAHSVSISSPR